MSNLIYLASPYSHPEALVRAVRFDKACQAAALLMQQGLHIFSPIAHTHPIALAGDLPKGWDFWQAYDMAFLQACASMIVLMIDGWQESKGVQAEIAIMRSLGKPIDYMPWPGTAYLCECGNWDLAAPGYSGKLSCSASCGRMMREASAAEINEKSWNELAATTAEAARD